MTEPRMRSPDLEEMKLRQQAIGEGLRQIFDDVVNEPVPEDFLDILRRAEAPHRDEPPTGDVGPADMGAGDMGAGDAAG
ncbi:MAG: hypothetical protein KGL69_00170 [Alphaproteobacteria bacterium]|nr:hypothetical protein [Alphaproteobacteria bacterium]